MPGLRLPVLCRVFGVEPGLDRIAARRRRFGIEAATVGDLQLQLDQVQAGGGFGDGVLDLQPGVHLEEEEVAVLVRHELDGARAGVADRVGSQPRRVEQLGAHARCAFDERRGRFFDDLLVAALNGALAFADRPHGAVRVGEHLDLDVVAGGQVALAEHRRVAERRLRLRRRGLHLRPAARTIRRPPACRGRRRPPTP